MENQTISQPQPELPKEENTIKLPKFLTKKVIIVVVIILALGALVYFYKNLIVAATVNGTPIYRLEVVKELEKRSGKMALDAIVNEKLILAEADKQNIVVSDSEVNEQIKSIEEQVKSQGGTLDELLSTEGISQTEFRKQITIQKKAEKIFGDKILPTQEEMEAFASSSGMVFSALAEEEKKQVSEQLKQQKFSEQIGAWLEKALNEASIKKFINY